MSTYLYGIFVGHIAESMFVPGLLKFAFCLTVKQSLYVRKSFFFDMLTVTNPQKNATYAHARLIK